MTKELATKAANLLYEIEKIEATIHFFAAIDNDTLDNLSDDLILKCIKLAQEEKAKAEKTLEEL